MFEDFSFVSSSTTISANPRYLDSPVIDPLQSISPLASRSSTPTPHLLSQHNLTRDMRFNTSRSSSIDSLATSSRRLSIDTLTSQFDSHTPFESANNEPPRSAPIDEDEGFFDGPASDQMHYTTTYDDRFLAIPLNYLDYSLTSPSSSSSLGSNIPMTFSTRRRQRQILSRLQCLSATGQLDSRLSMLVEECHPSSLPDADTEAGESTEKSDPVSIITSGDSAIARPRIGGAGRRRALVKRAPRVRKRKL